MTIRVRYIKVPYPEGKTAPADTQVWDMVKIFNMYGIYVDDFRATEASLSALMRYPPGPLLNEDEIRTIAKYVLSKHL